MRLNRGTVILIVVSVILIVGFTLLSNQQAAAPTSGTATPTASVGPVFAGLDTSKIVKFEAVNNADSATPHVIMTKDAGGVWTVSDATYPQKLATDQTKASATVNSMATIVALDKFDTDKPSDYGLDKPAFTLTLTDSDGKTYSLQIGKKAVANPRYYAFANGDTKSVYILDSTTIDALTATVLEPDYVASPTPTATATATANPYSEVEQTATQNAIQQQVYGTMTATAMGTYSPTLVPTATPGAATTSEATTETTAEATAAATAEATTAP